MMLQISLYSFVGYLAVAFAAGVAVATLLYLHLSGIRITYYRTHEVPCRERYR